MLSAAIVAASVGFVPAAVTLAGGLTAMVLTDNISMADIDLLVAIGFLGWVKETVPDDCSHLKAWHARASAEVG